MNSCLLKRKVPALLVLFLAVGCPRDDDDALMLQLYHSMHDDITRAASGTDITPSYLAAIISLESAPPGNRNSRRFEPAVYERIKQLRDQGRPYGNFKQSVLKKLNNRELKELSTSYGLTQIMGYHCLELGCSVQDLKGDYHLVWAVSWMQKHYQSKARNRDWAACFRIHNTGRATGTPSRRDYVSKGLLRMAYYDKWVRKDGRIF